MPGLFIFNFPCPTMRTLTLAVGLMLSSALLAQTPTLEDYLRQAKEQGLAHEPVWLNLVHYDRTGPADTPQYRSQVDDDKFFLAENGRRDSVAELEATLRGLFAEQPQGNQHARCRFPARAAWLQAQLAFGAEQLPELSCPDYAEWRSIVKAERVTLIFPSYYLNSPSSMFGHTLLRLDPADESHSEWLSWAVNFGAEVVPGDNSMFYAFKGLTGGYPGRFNVEQYYRKIQEYNRDENRDIWEYPLNLSTQETERMVLHLWELKEIDFDYYFFDENCSYRVMELLEVARPGLELTERFENTAIPIDTVRGALENGLGNSRVYRPSKASELKERLRYIPEYLHPRVIALSHSTDEMQQDWFTALDAPMQARVIEAAYKYLRYRQVGLERDPAAAKTSFALLGALRQHAQALPREDTIAPGPPDLGHGSRRLSIGLGRAENLDYLNFGLRLSLHSLEERGYGFLQGAQINLGNFQGRLDEDGHLRIERIDLVDIFSLSPRDRFFKPLSWKVITGLEREWINGRERQVAHVNGGAGYATELAPGVQTFALAMARLEHNSQFSHDLEPAAGVLTGLLWHFEQHTARLELGAEKFANGVSRRRAVYRHGIALSAAHALSLEFERHWGDVHHSTRATLRYHYYYAP